MRVYLAAPFFTAEEIAVVAAIEKAAATAGVDLYSPRKDGVLKDMTRDERRASAPRVFAINVREVAAADLVLAVIDGHDAGTMFEMGYAYGRGVPIVVYSSSPTRGVNVMLRQSAVACVRSIDDVARLLAGGGDYREFQDFDPVVT